MFPVFQCHLNKELNILLVLDSFRTVLGGSQMSSRRLLESKFIHLSGSKMVLGGSMHSKMVLMVLGGLRTVMHNSMHF